MMKTLIKYRNKNITCVMSTFFFTLILLSVNSVTFAQAVTEQVVKITTTDNFKLTAQFSRGLPGASGVLFLHDCQHTATDYQPLYTALVEEGFSVLALDLRGYGGSQNELFSEQKIRRQSEGIVSYQGQLAGLMLHWQTDVFSTLQYMKKIFGNHIDISVVASGCSSNQAIYLAEKTAIKSVVMLAPELSNADKEQFKLLHDMPIYLLSSKYQTEAMFNAKELFDWNGDKNSILQIFKGNLVAHRLLAHQPYINKHIAIWLKDTANEH